MSDFKILPYLILAIFAHNVNFPGKLEKFTGILFSQDGSTKCTNWWNRTDISIDGHLGRK